MGIQPGQRMKQPKKDELWDAIDAAEARLEEMVGRWFDVIPEPVRLEIRAIAAPLLELLLRSKRR